MSAVETPPRPVITLDVARHVLWHFGDTNLGQEPGHFVQRLLVLASAADEDNLERVRAGWPELIHAWESVARKPWGLDWLRGIAKDYLDGRELELEFFEERS